jgi:short-subunit dehydrogenase
VSVHPADLAEAVAVSGLAATRESNGVTVDMLINSAGVGSRGNFVDEEPATIGSQARESTSELSV